MELTLRDALLMSHDISWLMETGTAYIQLTRKDGTITSVFSKAPVSETPTASAEDLINTYNVSYTIALNAYKLLLYI